MKLISVYITSSEYEVNKQIFIECYSSRRQLKNKVQQLALTVTSNKISTYG